MIKDLTKTSLPTAGFGGSYDDYLTPPLDLNALLVSKPAATVFMRVHGDDMAGAGITDDDILVLDRSITATNGQIVIAVVDGQFLVRHFVLTQNGVELHQSANQDPLIFTEGIEILGVVTSSIKRFVNVL
jgi:DNA polymerase V